MTAIEKADAPKREFAVKFSREWAMPNAETFRILPIAKLLKRYAVGQGWIDPFAGNNSPAQWTNDINPQTKAVAHLHAKEFIEQTTSKMLGAIFDPPYSLRQVKECYDSLGLEMSFEDSKGFPTNIKDGLARVVRPGGLAICCGWESNGFGAQRGFQLIEILLVPHGGRHNDTIVTVEQKIQEQIQP